MIEYKRHTGVFEYDEDVEAFVGHVVVTRDVITFVGSSVGELRDELKNSRSRMSKRP